MKSGGPLRRCGQRWATEDEALHSKLAVTTGATFGQGRCCGWWHEVKAKVGKALPLVSKRRAREIRERRAMLLVKYPGIVLCEVPFCNEVADDAHEPLTRARGGSITDPGNVKAVCRPHHDEITFEEPEWAYELGFLVHSWDRMDLVMIHAEDGGIAVWQSSGENLPKAPEMTR